MLCSWAFGDWDDIDAFFKAGRAMGNSRGEWGMYYVEVVARSWDQILCRDRVKFAACRELEESILPCLVVVGRGADGMAAGRKQRARVAVGIVG